MVKEELPVTVTVEVPPDLLRRFKAACAAKNVTMKSVIQEMMEISVETAQPAGTN